MRLWIQDDEGNMIVSSVDGQLYMHSSMNKEKLGFIVFKLLWDVMQTAPGTDAYYGSDLRSKDIEGGTANG